MRAVAGSLLLGLGGCGLFDDVPVDTGEDVDLGPSLSFQTSSGKTNENGRLRVKFQVPPGTASFQVTSTTEEYVLYEELVRPDGSKALDWLDWVSSPYFVTAAFYGAEGVSAIDWPVRDIDGPIEAGEWTAVLAVVDPNSFRYLSNIPVDVSTAFKKDPDLSTGRIGVQIVYADGVDADPAIVTAVEEAVERWRTVWGEVGLELVEHYESSKIDPDLPFAFSSDPSVENVANRKAEGELQLIVGERVGDDAYIYGVAAAIPGTIEVSPRTFVVLSWLTHSGIDGVFDNDEIRLMGETMAHEVGHYTGLFHPVETTYDTWDALDDTPDCGSASNCEDQLGKNLMFPYSLCNFDRCFPQNELSIQQASVVQQFVGAL